MDTKQSGLYKPGALFSGTQLSGSVPNDFNPNNSLLRPSKKKKQKKKHVSRPDFYKRESGRAVFYFFCFIISYYMLSLHINTFPQGYVGALRSNINKTKHQVLIKHKFV